MRHNLLQAQNTSFQCDVSADYGNYIHNFTLECSFDASGNMTFTAIKPESISGITGTVDTTGGNLTFDDAILGFPLLADGYISPVSAPWLFMKTLRSGYIDGCGNYDSGYIISAYDSFEKETMHLQIYTDSDYVPQYADFLWDGRRILSIRVKDFSCV